MDKEAQDNLDAHEWLADVPALLHAYAPLFNTVLAKRNPDQVGSERGTQMFDFADSVAINAMPQMVGG